MSEFFIERVQVEGGFLDGLDLGLKHGLNTIIGARGTGKSSLVELIRFCLGVSGHTVESDKRSISHARTVLQDGQVTLTLSDGNSIALLNRSVDDMPPPHPPKFQQPLIFSQTEVETVGLLSSGRLNLIDNFLRGHEEIIDKENSAIVRASSFSHEISTILSEVAEYEDKLLILPSIIQQLKELEPEEKAIADVSDIAAQKTNMLNELTLNHTEESFQYDYLNNYMSLNRHSIETIEEALSNKSIVFNTSPKGGDLLVDIRLKRVRAIDRIHQELAVLKEVDKEVAELLQTISSKKAILNSESQKLRIEIDSLQAGAGEIVRKGQNLRKEKLHLEALSATILLKNKRISDLRNERDSILDVLEKVRSERSAKRINLATELSNQLAPKIRVVIEEAGQLDEYINVLINSLKGSGLKYRDLAPAIADAIPPRELLSILDNNDIEGFVALVSISKDRASRVIQCLRDSAMDSVSTVLLDDEVKFELLDGTDYKDFSKLSTGQRCTVILPIILEHRDTILIVDQPEDHIDNAFIVDTLISAILRRAGDGQIIVTTHNANVPVLGDAQEVVHLGSDGRRGFVLTEGSLENTKVVEAISNVMEGGQEAFKRRANFYGNVHK